MVYPLASFLGSRSPHANEKLLSVLQVMEIWVGPGNEAISSLEALFSIIRTRSVAAMIGSSMSGTWRQALTCTPSLDTETPSQ